ncbi:MAG TPA: hypothetical protein VM681_07920 [Candidatus Thermoplasmatota archaeon]|nr:hypothetical protein [Candidatus Thermoplasmatota archaeon]
MTRETTTPPTGHFDRASGLNNFVTGSQGRVDSTKNLTTKELDALLEKARPSLSFDRTYVWDANINGIVVRLITNSFHQYDFWTENWCPSNNDGSVKPHAFIYSASGVPGEKPHAYYCPERDTSVFVNTEYYGQCKSWALGMAAKILEQRFNTHSIHGACAEVDGKGVVIIAPTGTGKTTQVNRLFQHAKGKVIGDDWLYIQHPRKPTAETQFIVNQPERRLYVRTENAYEEPWLRPIFDRCKLENVVTDPAACHHEAGQKCGIRDTGEAKCYWGFGNSRAILPRDWMQGPHKVADSAHMNLVVLLRRDKESPAEVKVDADEAIRILREGRTLIRPGAGPKEKWGTYGSEPWYNPYLLQPDHEAQERFFRAELATAPCIIVNTGAPGETIQRTYQRILKHLTGEGPA